MSLIRFHKLSILHILFCSFIHNIICSSHSNNPYIQSIHSLSTVSTSFIIPITLQHSKWFISNRNPPTNTLISLQSFLNTLTNSQHLIIQLQIDSIQTYNNPFLIDHFKQLYNIINQSDIYISKNIIISQEIPIQIMETISNENISITINIHSISTLKKKKKSLRILLSNETNTMISNTEYKIIEIESWICKPWPIYLGFFAGIGVTVIITFVMNLTTGEKDVELNNALAKFVTAGIYNGTETSVVCDVVDGPVEIIAGPTRHKKSRTNSAIILYHTNQLSLSPRSRTRSGSYIKKVQNIQLNQKYTNEPSWANDLQIPKLTAKGVTSSIEEENENDSNDSNNENNNNENIKYDQLKDHRNSLRIYTKNLLNAPNTITPIGMQTDITPTSDDIYLSNSSDSIQGQKTSDEMSISELTNNESEPIIKHKEFDYSDAIKQQGNKNNLNLAQNIDLSPIVESVVNFDLFKTRQQRQQRYRIKSMKNNNGMHITNLNGQKIRVGLNIKPYDCLGTSSENSDNNDDDDDDETNVDDDGMEGDDETDLYSSDEVP